MSWSRKRILNKTKDKNNLPKSCSYIIQITQGTQIQSLFFDLSPCTHNFKHQQITQFW
jgi:hypothetical protein